MSYRIFPGTPNVEFQNQFGLRTDDALNTFWLWEVEFELPSQFSEKDDDCSFQVEATLTFRQKEVSTEAVEAKCTLHYHTQRGMIEGGPGAWLTALYAGALNRFLTIVTTHIEPAKLECTEVKSDDRRIIEIAADTAKHYNTVFPLSVRA